MIISTLITRWFSALPMDPAQTLSYPRFIPIAKLLKTPVQMAELFHTVAKAVVKGGSRTMAPNGPMTKCNGYYGW